MVKVLHCSVGSSFPFDWNVLGPPIIESSTSTSTSTSTTISSLTRTCLTNDHCQQIISHSHCVNDRCQCLPGYIPLDDQTCLENGRILLPNNHQSTHQLSNSSTHYRSLLGGHCSTNENCQTLDARCVNQICTCPIDSFPIDEWNCLKDAGRNSPFSVNLYSCPIRFNKTFDKYSFILVAMVHVSVEQFDRSSIDAFLLFI